MTKIKMVAVGIIVIVMLGMSSSIVIIKMKLDKAQEEVTTLEEVNHSLDLALERLSAEQEQMAHKLTMTMQKMRIVDATFRQSQELLRKYRDRQEVVFKKPKLVERLANRESDSVFRDLSCSSGNTGACDDKVTEATTASDN